MSYLCNRNRETKIDNNKVPWMSGLVSGLQNRVRRFESARNLQKRKWIRMKISNPFSLFSYLGTFIKYYKISQLIHTQSIAN